MILLRVYGDKPPYFTGCFDGKKPSCSLRIFPFPVFPPSIAGSKTCRPPAMPTSPDRSWRLLFDGKIPVKSMGNTMFTWRFQWGNHLYI